MPIKPSAILFERNPEGKSRWLELHTYATGDLPAPDSTNRGVLIDTTTNTMKFWNGSTWGNVGVASSGTLDQAYNAGNTIDVDGSAVTLTVSNTDNNEALSLIQNDTTNNPVLLQLANTGTGSDIDGDNWSVSQAGVLTCTGVTSSGALTGTSLTLAGAFNIGTDGAGHDFYIYSDTAGDYVFFDDTNKVAQFIDYEIHMGDSDPINFGAGSGIGSGDFVLESDGTDITLTAAADVASQAFKIGDNTNDIDMIWYSDATGAEVTFDSSGDAVLFDGVDLRINDEDVITFGDSADFTLGYQNATKDLHLLAAADVADQALIIGDATNDMDIQWTGNTAGDTVLFDSSGDNVVFTDISILTTESATGTTTLDITNAATSVSVVEINATGALTDGLAGLSVLGTANIATGGCLALLSYGTGTSHADARMFEIAAAGKAIRGIFADVDSTQDAYHFHCGGASASGEAVVSITSDGTIASGSAGVLEVLFTGNDANVPRLLSLSGTGNGIDSTGIYMDTESNGTTAWNVYMQNSADAGLGVSMRTHHISASPAAADEIWFHECYGEDSGGGDTEYVRLSAQSLLMTAGAEDGEYVISVAANNGTLTQGLVVGPQLNSANTGISVGSGAAAGAVTSEGAFDLLLQTNYGTSSSNITITDGAAGGIALNMDTTGQVTVLSTAAGALGAVLNLSQQNGAGLEANGDVVGRIQFLGKDDADASESAGRIDSVARDVAAATPDFDMIFYTDVGGTETALLELNSYGVCLPAGKLSTLSTTDLVLDTNESTNSGSITIADGANGDITLVGNGAGSVVLSGAGLQYQARDIAAGTLTDTADTTDGLIQVSTNGANNCVATVPEAASNLGLVLTYQHDADGGKDVVVTRTGADTFDEDSDTGNVTFTMANAGECIQIMAVSDNQWMIIARVGGTLA